MTFVPSSGVFNVVVAAGPMAGAMGFLLIGLLAAAALVVVLGAERKRPTRCRHPVVALPRTPPDRRAAAA